MSILAPSRAAPLLPYPTSSNDEPVTPPTVPRSSMSSSSSALTTPPSSIQKYRDALRRDLTARYEAAARAGQNAKAPDDASQDPDYGYDENPFDTRARILLSFADPSHAPGAAPALPLSPDLPETPQQRKRGLDLDFGDSLDSSGDIVLDSPAPSIRSTRRRWSYTSASAGHSAPASGLASAAMSRSSSFSCCDTPGSEMSFEIGRTDDYLGLYGRPSLRVHTSGISPARTPPPPPMVSSNSHSHAVFNPSPLATTVSTTPFATSSPAPSASTAKERRNSVLGRSSPIKPLTQLTPPPQPRRSRRRKSRCVDGADWDQIVLTRSESETMLLAAAGFASQRSRGGL